jgi:hypothetical protein
MADYKLGGFRTLGIAASLSCALSYSPLTNAYAEYAAGYASACGACETVIATGLKTIVTAVEASTLAIGNATGMPPFKPGVGYGFPGLSDAVLGAYGSHAKHVVSALDTSTKRLASELRLVPFTKVQIETYSDDSYFQAQADEINCSTMAYGQAMTQPSKSSMSSGWRWVNEGGASSSTTSGTLSLDSDEAVRRVSRNVENASYQRINQDFQNLRADSAAAGNQDATISDILDPSALVSEDKRVFSDSPDEFGISDNDRMDYLIRFLTIDTPNQSSAVLTAATTPQSISEGTSRTIQDMRVGMSMTVLDNVMKTRRPSATTYGTAYLQKSMLESSDPNAATSDEEFVYRIAKYRQRDSQIMARMLVDDDAAVREITKMEAEQLAIKFQRWRFKRDTNLVLAQILADELRSEQPQ